MSNGGVSADVMRHSVTAGDHDKSSSGVFYLMLAGPTSAPQLVLPAYWSTHRDYALASTIHLESMWGSAIGKAISKQASLGWKVTDTDDSQLRTKRAQSLLHLAENGQGWVTFLSSRPVERMAAATCETGPGNRMPRLLPHT